MTNAQLLRAGSFGLVLVLGLLWLAFLRPTALGGSTSYVIVAGESMEPTYHTGDLTILKRQETYRKGDVIAYDVPNSGRIIHRVTGGNAKKGWITQGDNRDERDQFRPKADTIMGKVVLDVPKAGYAMMMLRNPAMWPLAGIGLLLFLGGGKDGKRAKGAPVFDYRAKKSFV
jgi:signal peptidase